MGRVDFFDQKLGYYRILIVGKGGGSISFSTFLKYLFLIYEKILKNHFNLKHGMH